MVSKNSLTIFLVDDDGDDVYLVKKSLSEVQQNVDVLAFPHGGELINYLNKAKLPSRLLILLDINMPVMNGFQTLEQLKSMQSEFKWIPVCIFTTSSDPEDIMQCYQLGANACFTKPTTFTDLIKLMDELSRFWFSSMAPV